MESKYCNSIFKTYFKLDALSLISHMRSSADARSVEKIQGRSLRVVLNDFTSEYGVLMEKYCGIAASLPC